MSPTPQYLTRSEAAQWLRIDAKTLDRHLRPVSNGTREPGTFRYITAQIGSVKRVRVLASDVYETLPQP